MESNKYQVKNFKDEEPKFQEITFYKVNEDGTYEQGTTLEEVLKVCSFRLENLNQKVPSEFNKVAIEYINKAVEELNKRTADRVARNVEGTPAM